MPLVIAGVFLFVVLILYTVLSLAEDRSSARSSLRQLEGYELENLREREMLNPLSVRVLAPVGKGLVSAGRRFTPSGYVESSRHKLTIAGRPSNDDLDRFLAIRVITAVLAPVGFVAVLLWAPLDGLGKLMVAVLVALAFGLGPDAQLNRSMAARQRRMRVTLPDILDLLTISVEAGLGFEQALDRTVIAVPGPLAAEFARMLGEIRAGAGRADSLRMMSERIDVPEVRSFVLALIQAETFGVSIARVLRNQADEMRVKRRQFAQERAQKAQVKMLIPMVLCIFPAFFVVVLGPAIIQVSEGL